MARAPKKSDFPVNQVRRYLEPGPIVLVSSEWQGKTNMMTMGWHTVSEFTPSLVGCIIASGNHSFQMVRSSPCEDGRASAAARPSSQGRHPAATEAADTDRAPTLADV